MVRKLIITAVVGFLAAASIGAWPSSGTFSGCSGNVFYVSAVGSDLNCGRSPTKPWQTITKVNSSHYPTNAVVQFRGGDTFSGGIVIPQNNMSFQSYGTGQATISSGNSTPCFKSSNLNNTIINNLFCQGGGNFTNTTDGLFFFISPGAVTKLQNVTLTNSTVTGYGVNGIYFTNGTGDDNGSLAGVGWSNVNISNNNFHDNTGNHGPTSPFSTGCIHLSDAGTGTSSDRNDNDHITINNNSTVNCLGTNSGTNDSGYGIFLNRFTTGSINNNLVHDAGNNEHCVGGTVGIETAFTNGITIQKNEVFNVAPNTSCGNAGIDTDIESINNIVQYNWVHAATNGLYQQFNSVGTECTNNIFRFNIGEVSAGLAATPMQLVGADCAFIYNNTFFAAASNGADACFNGTINNGLIANNICWQANGAWSLNVAGGTNNPIQGNDFTNGDAVGKYTYLSTNYTTLSAFQTACGSQCASNVASDSKIHVPGGGGTTNGGANQSLLINYMLNPASPMINAGLNLTTLFGINLSGVTDFYGNSINASSLPIGATNQTNNSYVGPADLVSNPKVFYGLRAMNLAYAQSSGKLANIIRISDSRTCDILANSTNGQMGVTGNCSNSGDNGLAIATWCNGTTCKGTKWYDQTQGNQCTGSTSCDLVQATGSLQPILLFNCSTHGLPCFQSTGTQYMLSANTLGVFQPFTIIGEIRNDSGGAGASYAGDHGGSFTNLGQSASVNQLQLFCGTSVTASMSDGVMHAGIGSCNNTSSYIIVDGTATTGLSAGTLGLDTVFQVFNDTGTVLTGRIAEVMVHPTTLPQSSYSLLSSNMAAYY